MLCTFRTQRQLIWISIASAFVFFVGYYMTGMFPPPPPELGPADVSQLYTDNNIRVRLGVVIALIGAGFWCPWSIAVAVQMSRLEKGFPAWSAVQCITGLTTSLFYVLPVLCWGTAAFFPKQDPVLMHLINELGFLTFVTPISFYWLQILSISMVAIPKTDRPHSAFPRWVGYFSIFVLLGSEMGVMAQLFETGPFAWNGIFPFWVPLTVSAIWFGVISVYLLRAITQQEMAEASGGRETGINMDRAVVAAR